MAVAFTGLPTFFNATGTSGTLTAPPSLGASDLDLVVASIDELAASLTLSVSNDGTAYTQIFQGDADNNGTRMSGFALWIKAGAASPGSVTVSWGGSSIMNIGGRFRVTGADTAFPTGAQSAALAEGTISGSGAGITVPGITTLYANSVVAAVVCLGTALSGNGIWPGGSWPVPSGWTSADADGTQTGANDSPSLAVYYKAVASPGSSGDLAITGLGGAFKTANWIGGMVEIRDAAAPPPASTQPGSTIILGP